MHKQKKAYLFTYMRERGKFLPKCLLVLFRCTLIMWDSDSYYLKTSQITLCYGLDIKRVLKENIWYYPTDAYVYPATESTEGTICSVAWFLQLFVLITK
jgi:hypothetical protein